AAEKQFQADLLRANQETNAVLQTELIARAHSNYAVAYPAPTNVPNFPTAGEVNSSLPGLSSNRIGRPEIKSVLTGDTFTTAGKLIDDALKSNPPTINNRMALNIAAGDVATEGVLNLLLSPGQAGKLTGKRVLFGVTMVSINPGRKTRQHYAGDITADADL